MNKDRINIDDFVREKLGAHTEKDDSAAWLKMKALLDKEMPERVAPIGFRFGKPLVFIAAALFLGVLCVGGYKLTNKSNENESITIKNTTTTTRTNNYSISSNSAPTNTTPVSKQQIDAKTDPITLENNHIASKKKVAESLNSKFEKNQNANKNAVVASKANSANSCLHPDIAPTSTTTAKAKSQATHSENSVVAHKKMSTSKTKVSPNTKDNFVAQNVQNQTLTQTKNEGSLIDKANKQNKVLSESHHQNKNLGAALKKTSMPTLSKTDKSTSPKQESFDSIASISVVTKEITSKGYPRKKTNLIDTVANQKIAVVSSNSQLAEVNASSSGAEFNKKVNATDIAPSAKTKPVQQEEEVALDSKTKDKNNPTAATAKKKEKKSTFDFLKKIDLNEAVADAKRDLGNAQFYFGFNAGLNYTFNNNSKFQGVQFGPTGELVFNKHWSLFGAINYFNRSGGKKTVNDNYANEIYSGSPDSTKGANYYFTIRTDSTNRYFNFSTLHSFEMPISLKYTINKFCVLAGINMAYYLKVNVEEVEKKYNSVNPQVRITNVAKPILGSSSPQLEINDFGARFGLGYVLGLGYKITPAWQADLRMVNSFWDNARGNGAQRLSKDFYKLPSIQITIGYQFNRANNRPTFGPTSTP